jgi:hypothetical protein
MLAEGNDMENLLFTTPHSCCVYHTNVEQAAIVRRFIHCGLTRHEKILSIINPWDRGGFLPGFHYADIDLASAIRNGQVQFPTTTDTYLRTLPFNPAHMIQILRHETDQAIEEGFAGLRVTADMTWALHHHVSPPTLIAYETQVDTFLQHSKCAGLCRYDRWHFPLTTLEDIVPIHASIIIRDREYTAPTHDTVADLLRELNNA